MTTDDKIKQLKALRQPKSICYCGHTGDGPNSEHEGTVIPGHGACTKCVCTRFRWKKFLPWMNELMRGRTH